MVKKYSEDTLSEMAAYYDEHGVVKLPGLIEPEQVDRMLGEIDKAAARADEPPAPGDELSFGKAEGRLTIRYLWRNNPVIRDFVLQPELAYPIARIVGSEQLKFWFDLTFMHNGSTSGDAGAGTPWHHDIAAFTFKGLQLPSLWMAMTAADENRSRLKFIDGSHKTVPGFYRTADRMPPADGRSDGFLDVPDYDALIASGREKVITWDVEAGDAIILHPYVVHGAEGNRGVQSRRVAITTRWLGDDVRFLPTSFAESQKAVGIAKSGLMLGSQPRGEYFPTVWPAAVS